MTTLTLTETSISPLADLTDIHLLGQYSESEDVIGTAEVRMYANGRRRVVTRTGRGNDLNISYRFVSRTEYNWLVSMVDSSILFRDQIGRVVYGVISLVSGSEYSVRDLVEDVTFTISSITYSEIV